MRDDVHVLSQSMCPTALHDAVCWNANAALMTHASFRLHRTGTTGIGRVPMQSAQ